MCRLFDVSRQGYNKYKESLDKPPKHAALLAQIKAIIEEDEYNDSYGRNRIHDALILRSIKTSISTVYRICNKYGVSGKKNKPKGLTKADKEAYKNDDLLKGDFNAEEPNKKLVSDITQLPTKDGPLYISGIFDCFDNGLLGLSMSDNMKTRLVIDSLKMADGNYNIAGAMFHTDRGSQYTSQEFRAYAEKTCILQSMSLAQKG
jgi:transposase InsO family protein